MWERFGEEDRRFCLFEKLNSTGLTFRQYFFRLSSFFPHKLFTNFLYDKAIKRTTNYFFDRFFSYFPLLEPFEYGSFFAFYGNDSRISSLETDSIVKPQFFSDFLNIFNINSNSLYSQRQLIKRKGILYLWP